MLKLKYIGIAWLMAMGVFVTCLLILTQKGDVLTQWFNEENFSHVVNVAYEHTDLGLVEKRYHEQYIIDPENLDIACAYIDALILNNSLIQAKNIIDDIRPKMPESYLPNIELYTGLIQSKNKKVPESIKSFQKASQSTNEDIKIRAIINLAVAYVNTNQLSEAEKQVRLLQSFSSTVPEIAILGFQISQHKSQYDDTKKNINQLKTLLEKDGPFIATPSFRVKTTRYTRNIEGKSAYLNEDTNLGRKNFTLGNAYLNLGRWDDAMEAFERSVQYPTAPTESHYWLGIDALIKRDYDQAKLRLDSALSKKKKFPLAQKAMSTIPK